MGERGGPMRRCGTPILAGMLLASLAFDARCTSEDEGQDQPGTPRPIDATTLRHKVLCGYQGWFRCSGDPANEGWRHWSRDTTKMTPEAVTFEMWPDMSEATAGEKFPAPGFTHPDGSQAHLFSSAHPLTVQRHFD